MRRLTLQTRLTASYGLLFGIAGAVMVAILALALRFLPDYDFSRTVHLDESDIVTAEQGVPPSNDLFAIASRDDLIRVVLLVSITALALVVAATILLGRRLARRLLQPVRDVNTAAQKAGAGDLSHRIGATGPRDELRELADTFDAMLARLQAHVEANRRFAANASHELLTPLATTRTTLQVMRAESDDAETAEYAAILADANDRSIDITRRLLELARLEQPRTLADEADLAALLDEALGEHRAAAEAERLTITVDAAQAPIPCDRVLLRQLLSNLIGNAVKHNHEGGHIDIRLRTESGTALLDIANSGAVLDPADLANLFEPFHRVDPRTSSDRGHGLGLAIAEAIVRAHHGTIKAKANPEGGLTIQVALPLT
ncbi:HAMP domain-containing sensor histidine kinase [Glycomyces sp. NPDC046736]|uniref:sensor histidine kinase n=1 Tax=Glycomyces sp. NPDC046736 TaxID=3155615 RepID=UPI0033BFF437